MGQTGKGRRRGARGRSHGIKSISKLDVSTCTVGRIYRKRQFGKKRKETNKINEATGVEHMEDRARRMLEGSKRKWGTTGGAMKDFNYKGRKMTRRRKEET